MKTKITKYIEIDAGHRVVSHDSKCRNVHGHRYKVEASCVGNLHTVGSQEGMVLDFSFLKEELVNVVDRLCDHAFILYKEDTELVKAFLPLYNIETHIMDTSDCFSYSTEAIGLNGYCVAKSIISPVCGKIYLVDFTPTAENLAAHWYSLLAPAVERRSSGLALLTSIQVWETPTSTAIYPWPWAEGHVHQF